jgi:hypothetical protein
MDRVPSEYGVVFDPETLALLRACLDDAWAQLNPIQQSNTLKSALALRILQAAAAGERDPVRLRTCALLHIASPPGTDTAQLGGSPDTDWLTRRRGIAPATLVEQRHVERSE